MDELKCMKQSLMSCVSSQIYGNLHQADTKQLGQAIDMIKDLSQAIYYCTVTQAMEKTEKQEKEEKYYSPYRYAEVPRMYYTPMRNNGDERRIYDEKWRQESPNMSRKDAWARDYREGQSPVQRKSYMEGKELHQDKMLQVKQLQKYMSSLSKDITEMIQDASPEQKDVLKQKLTTLSKMIV